VVFLDDDNVASSRFLERVVEVSRAYPDLGVFGAGRIEAEFETRPPEGTESFLSFLAIRSVEEILIGSDPGVSAVPWGAGLCVRRDVAETYAAAAKDSCLIRELDRKGASLISGGDDQFSWVATKLGRRFGIFPALKLLHLIDARRLTLEYLERLVEDRGYSGAVLARIHGRDLKNPFGPPSFPEGCRQLVRLHVQRAMREFVAIWRWSRLSALHKRFRLARERGWERALTEFRQRRQEAEE
jgi:hypothetical protein